MKRLHKNILGFSGLALVVGVTACAALMPGAEASAVTSTATDTVIVKVLESSPVVDLTSSFGEDALITEPYYEYNVEYNYSRSLSVSLIYTDAEGKEHRATGLYENADAEYQYNNETGLPIDLTKLVFDDGTKPGYGNYTVVATAIGTDGGEYFDVIEFTYSPVVMGGVEWGDDDEGNNRPYVDVVVTSRDAGLIVIRTADNEELGRAYVDWSDVPAEQESLTVRVWLDHLDETTCQTQLYVDVYHIEENGDETLIYTNPFDTGLDCYDLPQTGVPDTGGLFQDLNISKEDYLITGLIVFFVIGVVGFGVVARNHQATTTKKRR